MKLGLKHYLIIFILFLLGLFVSIALGDFYYWKSKYPPNCFFENIEVSGMKRTDVHNKLSSSNVDTSVSSDISLELGGGKLSYRPSELGISIDAERSVKRTSGAAYQHNFLKKFYKKLKGGASPMMIPLVLKVDRPALMEALRSIARRTDVASKDASVVIIDNGRGRIDSEVVGKAVMLERSARNLESALAKDGRASKIEVKTLLPRIYTKDIAENPPYTILSRFSTYFGVHNSVNRVFNINHAAAIINDDVLLPDRTYSFLNAIGNIDAAGGFKRAYVVTGDILDPQFGGGVCQVSTTLYNSAILAGLDIVERHNHSLYFNIYPLGRDASIYNWYKDLKFKNNTGNPLLIRSVASDTSVTVTIYGTPVPGKRVYFTSPTVYIEGERPPTDSPKQSNERIAEIMEQKKPFVSSVRMITYQDNEIVDEKEILSNYRFAAFKHNVDVTAPEPE